MPSQLAALLAADAQLQAALIAMALITQLIVARGAASDELQTGLSATHSGSAAGAGSASNPPLWTSNADSSPDVSDGAPIVATVSGGKAVLNCDVIRPANDSIDLILWFRGEEEAAMYSLDARLGPMARAKHFANSDDLLSRAFIDISAR